MTLDKREEDFEESSYEPRPRSYSSPSPLPFGKIALVVLVVVIIAGLGWLVFEKKEMLKESSIVGSNGNSGAEAADNLKVDQGKYQAVFLNNGEVYFGKIQSHAGSYLELTDIYYVQVAPVLQQGQEDKNNNDNKQQQNQISLVKLGGELHGPMDRMMMNKNMITYIEDLKDDSKVAQAIQDYKSKQK
jgi:hypothetical protein